MISFIFVSLFILTIFIAKDTVILIKLKELMIVFQFCIRFYFLTICFRHISFVGKYDM